MSAQDYVTIVREAIRALNDRDYDHVLSLMAEDVELTNVAAGQTAQGREVLKQWLGLRDRAFPDWKAEEVNLFGAGDRVCAEVIFRGTHTGPLVGLLGQRPIPPTGRRVELRACAVYEFKNGKIAAGRGYFDMATLLQQLGLMPQQKAA